MTAEGQTLKTNHRFFFKEYLVDKIQVTMKRSLKIIFIFTIYTLMCGVVLIIAIHESTRQPIGLIVVSMALTPALVAIFGGLPVNFLEEKFKMMRDNSSTTNEEN